MISRQGSHVSRFTPLLLTVCALLFGASAWAQSPPPGTPEFATIPATKDTLKALRNGGFVLYMRHGVTDNSRADQPDLKLDDCSTQRVLSPEGVKLAETVGKYIREAKIPIESVTSSPLCRAKDSAKAAFGERFTVNNDLMYTANLTTEQKKPVVAATRKIISEPVAAGKNRVVLAHAPNMFDVMGYFVKPEGTVVIIRPLGNNQFEYVASIPPTLWPELLR